MIFLTYLLTRHHLINFIPKLLAATSQKRYQIYRTLLKVIAHKAVSDAPVEVNHESVNVARKLIP